MTQDQEQLLLPASSLSTADQTLYDEWKEFLQSDREDVRLAAVAAVLQHQDALQLVQQGFVPLLAKLCGAHNNTTALQALVYLSSDGPASNQCLLELQEEAGGIPRMLELVLQPPPPRATTTTTTTAMWKETVHYAMSLLANMTRTEAGALELVGKTLPDEPVLLDTTSKEEKLADIDEEVPVMATKASRQRNHKMDLLLARFLNVSYQEAEQDPATTTNAATDDTNNNAKITDPYQHFSSILMNATQTQAGRNYLLQHHHNTKNNNTSSTTHLQTLLPQLRSPNPVRRRGLAGTLRNCCVNDTRDIVFWLLHQVHITRHVLYPLMGPEELTLEEKQGLDPELWMEPKDQREPDPTTRLWLVETILLVCASGRAARDTLRLQKVYVVLKIADLVEEDEQVSDQIYECVNYLRRDEYGTAEGSSDQRISDAYRKPSQLVGYGDGNSNYDGVD